MDDVWRELFDSGTAGFEPVDAAEATANNRGAAGAPADRCPPAAAAKPSVPEGATPIKGPAARLAQNMAASLGVPTATSFREVDVATLEARRAELNAQIAPRKVSFTHLIGWAIVQAAAEQRSMSHYYTEIEGQAYRIDPGRINLGLAVDVERKDGSRFLVVPVIKGADGMDFAGFHARYEELVEKARTNKLSPDDFAGATITLTNPGTLGTAASVPRLMPNQGTIVATGTIRTRRRRPAHDDHLDLRPPHHPGRGVGHLPARVEGLLAGEDDFYADAFGALGARVADVSTDEPEPTAAEAAAATAAGRAPAGTRTSSSRPWPPPWPWSRPTATSGTWPRRLDPLGSPPPGDPALDPAPLGLTPEIMAAIPAELLRIYVPGATLAEALPHLRRDVLRHDRVRGGAHRLADRARLAAPRHRVRRAPWTDGGRGPRGAARAADRGREPRAIPPQGVPRAEALQHRGPRRHGADARRDPRRRRRQRGAQGHDRHGAPRSAQRAGPRRRRQLRGDPVRVRGRQAPGSRRRPRRRAARTT